MNVVLYFHFSVFSAGVLFLLERKKKKTGLQYSVALRNIFLSFGYRVSEFTLTVEYEPFCVEFK